MTDKGAHFYKCDFQVHTPRDINWNGPECVADEDRQRYAAALIQACRDRDLKAIAITDHHDMAFVPWIRRAAIEETDRLGNQLPVEDRIAVFPGMELTLGVPCQALILFDANLPDDMFSFATTALALTPNQASESRTAQTERLHRIESLKHLKSELDKYDFLRDRYIVFPNVTNEGKSSILRTGLAGKYTEMPCVGGYLDGGEEKLTAGIQNILAGRDRNWGNKRVACFQTSDNRRADHRDLGRVSTWVKWATPTAEALRQACLAQESRVSQQPPQLPSVVATGMSVSNSSFLGPIELELNPQYNALIGGRGTGKSTILEYLRWALCDQPPGIADEDTPNYQARRSRLIESTLKPVGATVDIKFQVNGVPHLVRRNSQDGTLHIKISDSELRSCTEDEVRTLLPIQAYSQKQLSDVSVRVEELIRFVTAPIRSELGRLDQQITDLATRVRQAHSTRRRQRSLAHAIESRELEGKSLSEQADALRGSLKGLSEEDRALLDQGRTYENADQAVQSWQAGTRTFKDEAEGLLALIDTHLANCIAAPTEPHREVLKAAHDEYEGFLIEARAAVAALVNRASGIVEAAMSAAESPWRIWFDRFNAFKAKYQEAVDRSSAHRQQMEQLRTIEERLALHVRETARLREEMTTLVTAESTYSRARDEWEALLRRQDDLLDRQCAALTEASAGAIRARVQRSSDPANFVTALRQSLSGSRVQSGKYDSLTEYLSAAGAGFERWKALLSDLEKLAEFDSEQDPIERRPEVATLLRAGFNSGDVDRVSRSLTPDHWVALSMIPIDSAPMFEYRAREGDYIPFSNASAGQQATALLKTLLNQAGPPLIIDQPEEDLDNPVMLEVVGQVWQAKQKRQLIFASHNANLVVNGDAELVAWCDYRVAGDQSRGKIAGEGAIDVAEVRDAIKRIMEGGEAAFNLRREKYGF
jgi:chromosome segregation protein